MLPQMQGLGNTCKSCNYTARTGEFMPNYTPVGHFEVTRRQVELQACLRNTRECKEWQKAWENGPAEAFQRDLVTSRRNPCHFSHRSPGATKWNVRSERRKICQVLKHSRDVVCACHQTITQTLWVLFSVHCSAFPSSVCNFTVGLFYIKLKFNMFVHFHHITSTSHPPPTTPLSQHCLYSKRVRR